MPFWFSCGWFYVPLRQRHTRMGAHPLNINTARVLNRSPSVSDGRAGLRGSPFVHLVVAIGKVKNAGPIVIASRHVVPLIWVGHGGNQPAVVDGISILVRKDPEVRRHRCARSGER